MGGGEAVRRGGGEDLTKTRGRNKARSGKDHGLLPATTLRGTGHKRHGQLNVGW